MKNTTETKTPPLVVDISSLVRRLDCEEMPDCQRARQSLVEIGRPAVTALIGLLKSDKQWVRWEAAKALGQIGDATAIPALIDTLEDPVDDVRWLAAEALIRTGNAAVAPLLQGLIDHPESFWIYEGAHHVLNHMARRDTHFPHHVQKHPARPSSELTDLLVPLLVALEHTQVSGVEVPVLAREAIEAMKG